MSPVGWAVQTALQIIPVHSSTNSISLVSILAKQQLRANTNLFNHISTTVYSQTLIYTAEWTGRRGENENTQTTKR